MGEHQTETILARARQNLSQRWRDEMLELVDVAIERTALRGTHPGAAHGHLLQLGHDEAAEQVGVFAAYLSLWQLRQKDFPAVHHCTKVDAVFALRHHVANRLGREKSFQPRDDRADAAAAAELGESALPIVANIWVADCLQKLVAPGLVNEEAPQVGEGAAFAAFEECEHGVLKHGVHLITPACAETLEHRDQIAGEQLLLEVGMRREDVERDNE